MLKLHSMEPWEPGRPELRETADPATWDDWVASVRAALASRDLHGIEPPLDGGGR
jgi:hypothetical protein